METSKNMKREQHILLESSQKYDRTTQEVEES